MLVFLDLKNKVSSSTSLSQPTSFEVVRLIEANHESGTAIVSAVSEEGKEKRGFVSIPAPLSGKSKSWRRGRKLIVSGGVVIGSVDENTKKCKKVYVEL